jgi:fatty acyl-CoA reductase
MEKMKELSIKSFYENQEIFLTGGSGFVGKALIEKLLRSCSELKTIFVLMRPKRGVDSENRMKRLLENPVFISRFLGDPTIQEFPGFRCSIC